MHSLVCMIRKMVWLFLFFSALRYQRMIWCRGPLALPMKHREEVGLTHFPKNVYLPFRRLWLWFPFSFLLFYNNRKQTQDRTKTKTLIRKVSQSFKCLNFECCCCNCWSSKMRQKQQFSFDTDELWISFTNLCEEKQVGAHSTNQTYRILRMMIEVAIFMFNMTTWIVNDCTGAIISDTKAALSTYDHNRHTVESRKVRK